MRAIPECITEYLTPSGENGIPVSVDEFNSLFRMFWNDPDYTVNRYAVPDGHVYAAWNIANDAVSSYVWHVPAGF